MADGEGRDRPRRRRAAAWKMVPSALYCLGYVEGGETAEAIVRKFEELDKVRALFGLDVSQL